MIHLKRIASKYLHFDTRVLSRVIMVWVRIPTKKLKHVKNMKKLPPGKIRADVGQLLLPWKRPSTGQ